MAEMEPVEEEVAEAVARAARVEAVVPKRMTPDTGRGT